MTDRELLIKTTLQMKKYLKPSQILKRLNLKEIFSEKSSQQLPVPLSYCFQQMLFL